MFGRVTIPHGVWDEVVLRGDLPGASEVREARDIGWISTQKTVNTAVVNLLGLDLHRGEAEAIALAIEQNADLILLDETDARQVAATFGLKKTGVIGILIKAKAEGKISSLRLELNNVIEIMGFFIDDRLYCQALSSVNETDEA
jgi:predicted nucleic acid-binding protein